MTQTVGFKDGARFRSGFDREAGAMRLKALLDRHGNLDVDVVIKDAKRETSPLHPAFIWEADEALLHSHVITAQKLLTNFVTVTIAEDGRRDEFRAAVPVRILEDDEKRVYVSRDEAMSNVDYRGQVLTQAKNELFAFQRKYASLKELASIFAAIDTLRPNEEAQAA